MVWGELGCRYELLITLMLWNKAAFAYINFGLTDAKPAYENKRWWHLNFTCKFDQLINNVSIFKRVLNVNKTSLCRI